MPKNKILYVITQGGPWGGAQKYVFDLAKTLANTQNKYQITIAIGEPNRDLDLQQKLLAENPMISVIQLQHLRRDISPIHDLLAISELKKIYKKIKPDIVHLNSTKAGIIGTIAAAHYPNIRIVYTAHGWVFNEPMGSIKRHIYTKAEKLTSKRKNRIIVLSENDEKSAINKLDFAKTKLTIIPPAIEIIKNIQTLPSARKIIDEKRYNLNAESVINEKWIGTIANFYKTKGLDTLIKAISEFKTELNDCHFYLIGKGPEMDSIKSLINQFDLSGRVHLTGFIQNASDYIKAFDLFVLPSRKEGLPYALIEAKSYGIPIIATNVNGIPSIIEDKIDGTLVNPDDSKALGQAIINALKQSPKQASEKTAKADNFNLEKMVATTQLVYQSLLQEELY